MPDTVLVLGIPQDAHATHVATQLAERGVDVAWIDGALFPHGLRLAFSPDAPGYWVDENDRNIPFDQIRSVYWRNYNACRDSDLPNAEQADLAVNDARSLFESVLIDLPCRWVNGWRGFQLHQRKPAALARVARLDLGASVRIPATLQTNDPAAVVDFVSRVGPCIFKPVQGGAHTLRLTEEHLGAEHLDVLRHAPVTVQQEISGTDVRLFIAGQRVLACELLTDALDFRDDQDPLIQAIDIPDDVAHTCLKICRSLDLIWTGMDLRRTPEGEYFFFESNPSPMFLGFESRCGLPLSEALVDLLIERT